MRALFKVALIGLVPHLAALAARAETISVSLGDSSLIESSSAVINTALKHAHPPLQVEDWDSGGGPQTTPLVFGSGIHGPFNTSTYLKFHEGPYNNDGIIRIDTDRFPVLDVTEFRLDAGWEIRPIGSNPLVIRSLSNVEVHGVINCSGGDGEPLSLDLTTNPQGGVGRCGGSDGGRGGSLNASAEAGSSPSTNAGAGGGAGTVEGSGGGGGAGMSPGAPTPDPGLDPSSSPVNNAGNHGNDIAFEKTGGGGGGGGGELYNNPPDPTAHATGGGGGAGGGSIYIHAVKDITITGQILANGGNGGGSASAGKGGGGGGGAGGSIQIFAGGNLLIEGEVLAEGGAGGITAGGEGGAGGTGRTWVADSDGPPTVPGGDVSPMPIIFDLGSVKYQTGTFDIISSLIDTRASAPEFQSATVDATVSGASSVALEVAGSETPFDAASAQWISAASISDLNGKRYLRFRVRIDNQSSTDPVIVRAVTFEYRQSDHGRFEFASCQSVTPFAGSGGTPPWNWFLIVLAPFALWMRLRFKVT